VKIGDAGGLPLGDLLQWGAKKGVPMTVLDQIAREVKALPAKQRQESLLYLRTIRIRSRPSAGAKKPLRKTLGKARTALDATKGMWRNRIDLPTDTVETALELRRRVMQRKTND